MLDVLVNVRFHCGDGSPAIGMNALGDGYALYHNTLQAPGENAVTLQVADRGLAIAARTQVVVRVDAD